MNDKPALPAYLVEVKELLTGRQQPQRTFSPDPFLFTARQAAFQYAALVVAKKEAHEGVDVIIKLVEYDRTQIPNAYTVIATVFHQQFAASTDLNVLTIDVTLNDEAFNSPKAVWNSLGEMTCEYEYYHSHGYDSGFGYAVLNLEGLNKHLPEIKKLSALSDAQRDAHLATIQQPKPYSSFYMLYDAFAHAANLISHYNNEYASDEGILHFRLGFMPPQ
ncbi:hypothetical protein [Spirosoma spitsbergense]|uniref:hypothetical protein n=1 Tax=Spirosoma spitsbergense TaxID=431554 RepID=UPI00036CF19C|nr:hypothetical protein [Spirosoma spitsbergense]